MKSSRTAKTILHRGKHAYKVTHEHKEWRRMNRASKKIRTFVPLCITLCTAER